MDKSLDLSRTYLHLESARAERLDVDENFWPRVINGDQPLPGWLVAMFDFPATTEANDDGYSEMHPYGDEVHFCVSGEMTALLEHAEGVESVRFSAGETCVVPCGVWHRLIARVPSRILTLAFGEGTQHRPARAVG